MHRPIDDLLDHYLAATAAMSGALCFLVFLILLLRGSERPTRLRAAVDHAVDVPIGTRGLLSACRIGFAVLTVRYVIAALWRMGWLPWWTFTSDVLLLACDTGVIVAALYAVRQTTYEICGNRAVYIFGTIILCIGAVTYFAGGKAI